MSFFDPVSKLLTDLLGPLGPMIAVGMLGVLMVLITIGMMLNQRKDPLEKLKETTENANRTVFAGKNDRLRQASRSAQLAKYSNFLEPKNEAELSAARKRLVQAGYRTRDAVRIYNLAQVVLGVTGLLGGLTYYTMVMADMDVSTQKMLIYVLGPGAAGYMLPKYWVTRRVETRKEEITSGFPDSLDMMLVCVEAGQSLDQSIVRVARELRASYPSLADEYEMVANEMKAGKDKPTVLNDMSERCGVQDVSSFTTVLIQSATFGTSIAEALRVYASEMRDKRVMRAEEKANKLPTKMTLATMMLCVPPLLIILVGPSVHGITQLGNITPQ